MTSVRSIIREVMEMSEIHPSDIPPENRLRNPNNLRRIKRSKRYFLLKAKGSFRRHSGCKHAWSSGHSWSVLDLKTQRIHYRYFQACKTCKNLVQPLYGRVAVVKMVRRACLQYTGALQGNRAAVRPPVHTNGPHEQFLCEMCMTLGHECWK